MFDVMSFLKDSSNLNEECFGYDDGMFLLYHYYFAVHMSNLQLSEYDALQVSDRIFDFIYKKVPFFLDDTCIVLDHWYAKSLEIFRKANHDFDVHGSHFYDLFVPNARYRDLLSKASIMGVFA